MFCLNNALQLLRQVSNSFLELLYPSFCLHCQESLEKNQPLFCQDCLSLLELIDPKERCPYCFSAEFSPLNERCCRTCSEKPPITERMAAVFDYDGPAATMITHLKYGGQSYLASGAGAYLAAQFLRLEWPMPDAIVPMPMASLRRVERGYNQSFLLAKTLEKLLDRPVHDVLERRMGDYSQAGLNHSQRLQLSSAGFALKRGTKLHDQCVLLIDDVMTTGSSLRCCAEALQSAFPKEIYALTVCRAV